METFSIDRKLLHSLLVLAAVIENRDPMTAGHPWRVAQYARLLGESLGYSELDLILLELGGMVHDLGKVAIPDTILRKKGALTPAEHEIVRQHPQVGLHLVKNHPLLPLIEDAIRDHHERVDGTGYSHGKSARELGQRARIFALADAFDAMTSPRPYHPALPVEQAVRIMISQRERQFDPLLVTKFLEIIIGGTYEAVISHYAPGRRLIACPFCGPVIIPPVSFELGDIIHCPACDRLHSVSAVAPQIHMEWSGELGAPFAGKPDLGVIDDLINRFPVSFAIETSFAHLVR